MKDRIDISLLRTTKDVTSVDWGKYTDYEYPSWVAYIKYPVSQADLTRVCRLSNGLLLDTMGELYLRRV